MRYLPSTGFCLFLGASAAILARRSPQRHARSAAVLFVAVCAAGGAWSFVRTRDWRDDLTLFSRSNARDPSNSILILGTALAQLNLDRNGEAEATLRSMPSNANALYELSGLAQDFRNKGMNDKAAVLYRVMQGSSPLSAEGWYGFGRIELEEKSDDLGEREFREALRISPNVVEARLDLGESLFRRGARLLLESALALAPANAQLLNNLGVLAGREGDLSAACGYFRQAMAARPGFKEARENLEALPEGP